MAGRLALSRAARHLAKRGPANLIYSEAAAVAVPSFRLPAARTARAGSLLSKRFNSNGPEKIVQDFETNNPAHSPALSEYLKALISLEFKGREVFPSPAAAGVLHHSRSPIRRHAVRDRASQEEDGAPPPAPVAMDQEEPETWRSAGGGSFGSTVAPVAAPGELKSEEDERMFAVNRSLQWQYAAAAAAAALRPPVAVCRAQSPAARAIKKRKKRREGAFWAGIESTLPSAGAAMGINSLDEVAVVDRRVRGEEDLGRGGSATRAIKKREDGLFWAGMESTSWSAAVPAPGVDSLDEIAVVDGKLRDVLRGLGASAPVRIYGKRLSKSDRVTNQHRLLMSCRSWRHGEPFPFDEVLTAEERPSVQVQAYDRDGRPYVLDCKKLECNKAYRLIAGWRRFLTSNGLAVADDARAEDLEPAMVELWAFRSPALTVGVAGQPRGALGLVIVHYRQGDAPHADAAIAEVLAAARSRAAMPLPAAVPALEHPVGAAREDSMEEADDGRWPDARALEAAEALLMLSES